MTLVGIVPNPIGLFCILVLINFLNYTDRAILPGSANEFVTFISSSLKTDRPDVYFGVLQSSFIVGFSIASVLISRLVHFHGAFYLCSMGLMMWILAALMSGAGFFLKSFSLLLLGRMLSGIGEASFVCIVPPWIVKHAPSGQQGKWLAIFYTAIAVGTAFGYAYAAFVANNLGCHWSFVMEAFAMIPLIMVLLKYAPYYPVSSSPLSHLHKEDSLTPSEAKLYATTEINMNHAIDQSIDSEYELHTSPIISYPSLYPSNQDSAQLIEQQPPTSMLSELQAVLRSPIYLLITGGTACQVGVSCGLGTFGPTFLMGLGYFDSETAASSTFGSVVCLAGIIGTPLGGFLIDCYTSEGVKEDVSSKQFKENDEMGSGDKAEAQELVDITSGVNFIQKRKERRANEIILRGVTMVITISTLFGALFWCSVYKVADRALFLFLVTLGCMLVFLCNPGVNIALMTAVPEENRSFAIALTSICVHIFGDVPSPIIAGILKDILAPGCSPSLIPPNPQSNHTDTGGGIQLVTEQSQIHLKSLLDLQWGYEGSSASSECRADNHGLRLTMLIVSLWLFMSLLLFGSAWFIARKNYVRGDKDDFFIQVDKKSGIKKGKVFSRSKRAYKRMHLDEPLLCLDEDDIVTF